MRELRLERMPPHVVCAIPRRNQTGFDGVLLAPEYTVDEQATLCLKDSIRLQIMAQRVGGKRLDGTPFPCACVI